MNKDFSQFMVSGLQYWESQPGYKMRTPTYTGFPVSGDAFSLRSNGVHTIQIGTFGFSGNVQILATIDNDSDIATYAPIQLTNILTGDQTNIINYSNTSDKTFYSVIGNYTWLKVSVTDFTHGVIDYVRIAF